MPIKLSRLRAKSKSKASPKPQSAHASASAPKAPKPQSSQTTAPDSSKLSSGSRHLLLLGLGATLITVVATAIALYVYHESGDIYLDRSRPGFLPETAEVEQDKDSSDFSFADSGEITPEILDDFLVNLKQELNRLNDFSSDPFGATPLSDESLGI